MNEHTLRLIGAAFAAKNSTPVFCNLGRVYVTNIEGFAMVGSSTCKITLTSVSFSNEILQQNWRQMLLCWHQTPEFEKYIEHQDDSFK